MSSYSHDFNSFKLSFIPNAAINSATQPMTPTIVISALNLLLFASLMFQRILKFRCFQNLDFSNIPFDDTSGAFGLMVLAGFSFDIRLHERYVTSTDNTTRDTAMYTKLMSNPGFHDGML